MRESCVPEAGAMTMVITLELDLDGDAVSGHTTDAGGSRREFSGWIGLMGVLDALLDEARTASSSTTQGENDADR